VEAGSAEEEEEAALAAAASDEASSQNPSLALLRPMGHGSARHESTPISSTFTHPKRNSTARTKP
jgi:hypothetical protein